MQLTTFMIFANSANALFRQSSVADDIPQELIDQIDDNGYRLSVWTACDCKTRTKHRDVRCCKRTDMSDHSKCESLDTCVVPMPATSMICEATEVQACDSDVFDTNAATYSDHAMKTTSVDGYQPESTTEQGPPEGTIG